MPESSDSVNVRKPDPVVAEKFIKKVKKIGDRTQEINQQIYIELMRLGMYTMAKKVEVPKTPNELNDSIKKETKDYEATKKAMN